MLAKLLRLRAQHWTARLTCKVSSTSIVACMLASPAHASDQIHAHGLLALFTGAFAIGVSFAAMLFFLLWRRQKAISARHQLMICETHHRFGNQLQMLMSIARLNEHSALEEHFASTTIVDRIHALALTNAHLSQCELSGIGHSGSILIQPYLKQLAETLSISLGRHDILLNVAAPNERLHVDSLLPIALMIAEAVTNSYKHAFHRVGGEISISLREGSSGLTLSISDNGDGCAGKRRDGSGSQIIRDLAAQIGTAVEYRSGHHGTSWRVSGINRSPTAAAS